MKKLISRFLTWLEYPDSKTVKVINIASGFSVGLGTSFIGWMILLFSIDFLLPYVQSFVDKYPYPIVGLFPLITAVFIITVVVCGFFINGIILTSRLVIEDDKEIEKSSMIQ